MQAIQRSEAIDLLLTITEVSERTIEGFQDYALEAWLGELGYEWDQDVGVAGAMRQQLTAAVSALRLVTDSTPGKTATVWMSLDAWTEHLADVARYGADQWRRGNAGQEPQEFEEWRMEQ